MSDAAVRILYRKSGVKKMKMKNRSFELPDRRRSRYCFLGRMPRDKHRGEKVLAASGRRTTPGEDEKVRRNGVH